MNLNHSQLIAAITPGYQQAHTDYSAADVQRTLESYDIATLRRMYDRQVAAGIIQQPEEPPRVPEGITQVVRQQVANTPEALENQRLKNEMVRNQGFAIIFTTPIPEAGGRTATDNQANRETIQIWAEAETTTINNVKAWWTGIFKQNPGLAAIEYGPIVWDKLPIPKAQKQAQDNEQFRKDAETFYEFARDTGRVSASHANFLLVHLALGPGLSYAELSSGIVDLPSGPSLVTAEGETIDLSPPTRAELETFRQEKIEIDQDNLKHMTIAELRQRAKQDAERRRVTGTSQPSFYDRTVQNDQALRKEFDLSKGFEQQVLQARYTEPLPTHYHGKPLDAAAIRALDRASARPLVERYGTVRLNARLYGFSKVRRFDSVGNPIEGAPQYVFEEN